MLKNEVTEEDIWEYKSIRKSKPLHGDAGRTWSGDGAARPGNQEQQKKAAPAENSKRGKKKAPAKGKATPGESTQDQNNAGPQNGRDQIPQSRARTPTRKKTCIPSPRTPIPRHRGHCPSCQMPFAILLVQTPRWHVSECLDTPSLAEKECPGGISCDSTIPSHYKKFSHFQLAQSRAVEDLDCSLTYSSVPPSLESARSNPTCSSNRGARERDGKPQTPEAARPVSNVTSSQKSPKSHSPASSQDSVKQTSLDVWLSSPSKRSSQGSASPENFHADRTDPAVDPGVPLLLSEGRDRYISYSPLRSDGELFSDDSSSVKSLVPDASAEDDLPRNTRRSDGRQRRQQQSPAVSPKRNPEASLPGSVRGQPLPCDSHLSESIPVKQENWSEYSSPEWDLPPPELSDHDNELIMSSTQINTVSLHREVQSQGSGRQVGVSFSQYAPGPGNPRLVVTDCGEGSSQGSTTTTTMPSVESKAKKQMDIGVFFGLKPKLKQPALPLKTQSLNEVTDPVSKKPGPSKRKAQGSPRDADARNENSVATENSSQKRWGKKFRQNSTGEEGKVKKQCPFYKKIPGTSFTVDAFQYGQIEGCSAYFLTHFHSDHYGGLTKKFRSPIYCSQITGNLVQSKLRVEQEFINVLPMDTECMVNHVRVVLLDANHCPGAVLLLFILPGGSAILHTGDFRAEPSMENYPSLIGRKIQSLYLDTTYCSPEYTFPPQHQVIQFAANTAFETVTLHPRTLVVCGTYSVGKERVFLAIAEVLGCKASMSQDKYKTMQCLESEKIRSLVTTDWHSTALHILPMMQVNVRGLYAHLNKFSGKYDRVLAFKPTGWTYSDQCSSVENIQPEIRGKVTLYGVPYSEHSSYLEMKRFVQWCKPQKIIPTVNVGSPKSRATMEKYFKEWSAEAAYKPSRKKP